MTAKQKNKVRDLVMDYKQVFTSQRGGRILNDLIIKHYGMKPTHAADPCESAFREGQRFVILNILEMMRLDPDKFRQQMNNAREEYDNSRSFFDD